MSVTQTNRNVNDLSPQAKQACQLFFQECYKAGIHLFVTETYRSQERQNYLYAQGRTRPGNVVTWTLNSRHKSRLAWDVGAAQVNGNSNIYNSSIIAKAGAVAKKLGITWGGVWRPPDGPHFEVKSTWKMPAGYKLDKNIFIPTRSNQTVSLSGQSSTPSTPTPKPSSPISGGMTITTYLNSKGIDSSFSNRAKLAAKYGISGYQGTANQNIKLLELVRADLEKKPSQPTQTPPKNKEEKGVSTMKELNGTLRAHIVGRIAVAVESGVLKDKKWLEKAKKGELTASELAALHMYTDRGDTMKSCTSHTMKKKLISDVENAYEQGVLHDEDWLKDLKSGELTVADGVLLTNYVRDVHPTDGVVDPSKNKK